MCRPHLPWQLDFFHIHGFPVINSCLLPAFHDIGLSSRVYGGSLWLRGCSRGLVLHLHTEHKLLSKQVLAWLLAYIEAPCPNIWSAMHEAHARAGGTAFFVDRSTGTTVDRLRY